MTALKVVPDSERGSALAKPAPHRFQVNKEDVGNRIYQLRQRKNWTQGQLGGMFGKSRPAIAQWETGAATPSLSDLQALAHYLGSTPQYIAFGVTSTAQDALVVPVMDYRNGDEAEQIGQMSLDMDFYEALGRTRSAQIRAYVLPRDNMLDGVPAGSRLIIDESDRNVIGGGEAFLIFHRVPAVAIVGAVPGQKDMYSLKIGAQYVQTAGPIPVIGRVVAIVNRV